MIHFLLAALAALSVHSFSQAQTIHRPAGAGYIGSGAYSNSHTDAFSFISNQASLAAATKITGGGYSERRFMLNELNLAVCTVVIPTRSGNFGLKAVYDGFSGYNETQVGLAYGRKLGDKIDIGVQFNYNGMKAAGYGHVAALGFEAGAMIHLTTKLNGGVHVCNPVGGKIGKKGDEKLPFVYAAGLGFEASGKFFISTELEKEEGQPVNVNAALQYRMLPRILVRAGLATATLNRWFGIGVIIKTLRIDVTAGFHPQLGITPGLLLLFNAGVPANNEEINQ